MARLVFGNIDLVRAIYSFGDPSHRKFTHDLKWDLRPWPETVIQHYQDRSMKSLCSYTLYEYLYDYPTHQLVKMIQTYKRCYCCERHNSNKPFLKGNTVCISPPSVHETSETWFDCPCTCRALTRKCVAQIVERNAYEN